MKYRIQENMWKSLEGEVHGRSRRLSNAVPIWPAFIRALTPSKMLSGEFWIRKSILSGTVVRTEWKTARRRESRRWPSGLSEWQTTTEGGRGMGKEMNLTLEFRNVSRASLDGRGKARVILSLVGSLALDRALHPSLPSSSSMEWKMWTIPPMAFLSSTLEFSNFTQFLMN